MVGMTLVEIRDHIETLAADDGQYRVVCGRTGVRPVPADGKRFADRPTARRALRATEQYRQALRAYDPQVPYYDLIICQDATPITTVQRRPGHTEEPHQERLSEPVVATDASTPHRRNRVEFCHRVAGAVFEALSEAGYEGVERAVMKVYFNLAETVSDADELCLCLLESMATELDTRLDPIDQRTVLTQAATRLGTTAGTDTPLTAAFEALKTQGLLGGYTRSPWSVESDGRSSTVIQLSEYALSAQDGRLPVLPIGLELYRQAPDHIPTSLRAIDHETGWQVQVMVADQRTPAGLACAPITPEVEHGG